MAIAMNQEEGASGTLEQYAEEFALVFTEHAKPVFNKVQAKTVLGTQGPSGRDRPGSPLAAKQCQEGDLSRSTSQLTAVRNAKRAGALM